MSANADKLLSQLKAEKAFYKYDYGNSSLDPWLTSELVRLLDSQGITDIRNIQQFDGPVQIWTQEGTQWVYTSYFYDALTARPITGIGGNDANDQTKKDVFASTRNDDYIFTYHVRYGGNTPYFVISVAPVPKSTSFAQAISETLAPMLPVIMIGLNIFAPGFASAIGQSIFGTLGVTAPTALATALGNVAISTATNGGDIESAIKGSMIGALGAQAGMLTGGWAQTATGSDWIAKAASAATSAIVTGGDITTAVLNTAIPAGAKAMGDFYETSQNADIYGSPVGTSPEDLITQDFNFHVGEDSYPFETGQYMYTMGADPLAMSGEPYPSYDPVTDPIPFDDSGLVPVDIPIYTDTPQVIVAETTGGQTSVGNVLASLTQLAIAAIKINAAYQQAGNPGIRVSGQTAAGQTVIASKNGTVAVNGRTQIPPRGVPYVTPDGGIITNNGDGTYTLIDQNGISATNRYPAGLPSVGSGFSSMFGGVSSQTLMIAGAGLLAVLLLSKKGR